MNKNILFLSLCVFLIGCNQVSSSYNTESLNELDMTQDIEYVSVDEQPRQLGETVNINLIEIENTNTEIELEQVCSCSWESWEQQGMMCLGFVCSESCPDEQRACWEKGPACIARGL